MSAEELATGMDAVGCMLVSVPDALGELVGAVTELLGELVEGGAVTVIVMLGALEPLGTPTLLLAWSCPSPPLLPQALASKPKAPRCNAPSRIRLPRRRGLRDGECGGAELQAVPERVRISLAAFVCGKRCKVKRAARSAESAVFHAINARQPLRTIALISRTT